MTQFYDDDEISGKKLKDYFKLILLYRVAFIIIFALVTTAAVLYTFTLNDIYSARTKLRLNPKNENILEATYPQLDQSSETFILTQIEILKSYYIRDWVAKALIDSIKIHPNTSNFSVLIQTNPNTKARTVISQDGLRQALLGMVSFEQSAPKVNALDIITTGNNFEEARLISSTYAHVFVEYSMEMERLDVTSVKNYLASEKENKSTELNAAESNLENFQKRTGIINLESQAQNIVSNISTYEAEKNKTEIDINAANNTLDILNNELKKIDPNFSNYIESQLNEPYLKEISGKIADLEVSRDLEASTMQDEETRKRVLDSYNSKLVPLKKEYEEKKKSFRAGILSRTPAEMQNLTDKILDASLVLSAATPKYQLLARKLNSYEGEFNSLPTNSLELAKLERARKSSEKLYLILEEKYQEASINERSRLGNASILDPGTDYSGPVGPNRRNIIVMGIFSGLILGFVYAIGRDFISRKIKDPDELEKPGMKFLTWIPSVDGKSNEPKDLLIMESNIPAAEAFRALRTRIRYTKHKKVNFKTLLVTSCLPGEGKSFIAANLAGSFSLAGKKILLIDCDLRKPTIHTYLDSERIPGLSDLLFNKINQKGVIRKTKMANFDFITAGTIPKNPSELIGSERMQSYLNEFEQTYDLIILDCPAFLSVTEPEILYNMVHGTILVARAGKTPKAAFQKVQNRLKEINPDKLLGCVLNDFSVQRTFGKYYYGNYSYDYTYGKSEIKLN